MMIQISTRRRCCNGCDHDGLRDFDDNEDDCEDDYMHGDGGRGRTYCRLHEWINSSGSS